ncbi:hypothetical protein NIPOLPBK_00932 [Stenotrophomonas maltophilia]|uniref:hypothetical protein n=1 Tax=Stenotrophomonas TaxID=40323 RepID=UPI000AAA2459|nr:MULTISPECIES: hypothetical protein [Stenotrophomonas]EKT4074156.1 hypothetical protein [Stenotrophomonas maltophilia]QGL72471.1 hypothetical protein FEO85_13810 [Stenotrophomonas maltophilia]QNG67760.1 hypothetical protein NIPOLPBK_00932 [Stenotrophomonas maltophilia]WBL68887.1 hypothetical protein SMAL454_27300 [Stenotrophomonas maltophilia]HDX0810252.1 hypothetical protein [Stenotrophomonas maltophilia]
MFLYHCTDSENLCKIALDDFTKDNVIRGLCFSDNALDHFGDVTYRIELRDEENMLTTDMLHNLDVSPTNSIDYMSDRHGNPLIIRGEDIRSAFEKACLEFDYDKEQWENLWACAIEFDDCSGNDELIEYANGEDPAWDLQSIRGRTAYHLGLAGAVISDENGTSYIISDSSLRLDRVEYDDENMEDQWRVVERCSHTKGADESTLTQKEFQTNSVEIPPSFKECVASQHSLGPASVTRVTSSRRL